MSTGDKQKVCDVQKAILSRLADCERKIGALYKAYASVFSEMARFWNQIADEEEGHARMLLSLHRQLDRGNVFFGIGRFSGPLISELEARVAAGLEAAQKGDVTLQNALATSFELESSITEGHFYDVVTSDAPEFKTMAEQLSLATRRHKEMIREKVTNIAAGM